MSFSSHVKIGGVFGFTTGAILAPHFYFRAQEICREKNEIKAIPYLALSLGLGLGGGPSGALTGAALYGTKKGIRILKRAPRTVQGIFWGSIAASGGGSTVYELHRRNKI